MFKMTYTNSFTASAFSSGGNSKGEVIVATQSLGRQLIDKWNEQAKNFPAKHTRFSYALNSFSMPTKEELEKLGTFTSLENFHSPHLAFRG